MYRESLLAGFIIDVSARAAELADRDDVAAGFLFMVTRQMQMLAKLEPGDKAPYQQKEHQENDGK